MRGADQSQPGNLSGRRRRWLGHAVALAALVCGLLLLLTSTLPGIVEAALAGSALSLDAVDRDGTYGGTDVLVGDVYPGSPVLVVPAVVFHLSSDLEWRLRAATGPLPAGCVVEERPAAGGAWTDLSQAGVTLREAQPAGGPTDISDALRLAVGWDLAPGTYTVNVTYTLEFTDQTSPLGTIAINGGAAYANAVTSSPATLNVSASDPGSGASGMEGMCFSDNGTSWSAWQGYAPTSTWTLPAPDGPKTVWAKFRDRAGNESAPVSGSIILDRTPPVIGAVTLGLVTVDSAQVSWSVDDPTAANQVEYWATGAHSYAPNPAAMVTSVNLTGLTGGNLYHSFVSATDPAGNRAASSEADFWTLCRAPTLTGTLTSYWFFRRVDLSWTASPNAVSYTVYRQDLDTSQVTTSSTTLTSSTEWFLGNRRFAYWVTAVNGGGAENASNTAVIDTTALAAGMASFASEGSAATADVGSAPEGAEPVAVPSMDGCVIAWLTDGPATSVIMWRPAGLGDFAPTTAGDGATTEHLVVLTGLLPETTYDFYAVSTDDSGQTWESAASQFTTLTDEQSP